MSVSALTPSFDAPVDVTREPVVGSIAHLLAVGDSPAAITFAGQGWPWWVALEELLARRSWLRPRAERWVDLAITLTADLGLRDLAATPWAFDPLGWERRGARPDDGELSALALSMPGVLLTQLLAYRETWEDGLHAAVAAGSVRSVTGHSGGIVAAGAVAADPDGLECDDVVADAFRLALLIGHLVGTCDAAVGADVLAAAVAGDLDAPTPMAAVHGVRVDRLAEALAGDPRCDGVEVALVHGPSRAVVSGRADDLRRARAAIDRRAARDRVFGRPVWEPLSVGAPCHHPGLAPVAAAVIDAAARGGLQMAPPASGIALVTPDGPRVLAPGDGSSADGCDDLVPALVHSMLTRPGRWSDTARRLVRDLPGEGRGASWLLDLGPTDGIARLSAAAIRGTGARLLSMSREDDRRRFVAAGAAPADPAPRHEDLAPRVVGVPGMGERLENRFTLATGRSPVILAGMTPTTVDAPIVAAAAEAGFVAELAGGGQVSESIFAERIAELRERLQPGHEVVLNALYLDPYLWGLQLGRARLVQAARRAGAPICGVTVSAGIPPLDEAVALLDELAELGMWCNAFKPGTVEQVAQVLAIADAAPEHTVFVHLEGGTAGGHHSWVDLEDLLLATYHDLRARPNVVLCAGGGVGTPARAADLLQGTWSLRHTATVLPVDAVLIGTAAMAAAEASATPSVKTLLRDTAGVEAAGSDAGFVAPGSVRGAVTSGRSGLDADIHFVDNAAARCARLLDEVAGDEARVAARRDEIVAALERTAKPYFGDVADMTYGELLGRFVELCALGCGGRYEDGRWLDPSHRTRFVELLQRAEGRLHPNESGDVPTAFAAPPSVDDPEAAIATLVSAHPAATTTLLHPADVGHFLAVCRRAGKPVPFVPVIDADVRRWYQSDSLWQAQHPAYDADQVLVIPGPAAVGGIEHTDEPIAELLARFESHVVQRLRRTGGAVDVARRRRLVGTEHLCGPVPALLESPTVVVDGDVVPNPVLRLAARRDWSVVARSDGRVAAASVTVAGTDGRSEEATLDAGEPGTPEADAVLLRITFPGLVPYGDGGAVADDAVELRFVHTRSSGVDVVELDTTHRAAELARLSTQVLGALEPVPVGTRATQVVAATDDVLHRRVAHARLLGSSSGTLADGWSAVVWPSVFAVLGTEPIVGSLLDLVHLEHRVDTAVARDLERRVDLVAPSEASRWTVVAEVVAVIEHDAGTRVDTLATVRDGHGDTLAELRDAFLLRGTRLGGTRLDAAPGDTPPDLAALSLDGEQIHDRTERTLGRRQVQAPDVLDAFAAISGDHNPIHRSTAVARLAGLDGPVVHGAWTSAAAQRCVVELAADGDGERLIGWHARFVDLVQPGEALTVRVARRAVVGGDTLVVATVTATRDEVAVTVLTATARVRPPRTAYLFPGQGIQRDGMGMDGFERSAAAREVWERADAHTRGRLGFSILHIVRDNPTVVAVRLPSGATELHRHPAGVLHLTQFTQVAMAALAMAQVAEMRAEGVFDEEAVVAGHSVGEYNALASIGGVLPLEVVVELVFRRGQAMHHLVPRDDAGRSDYRLGVVRPHQVGMDHTQVEELVVEIRDRLGSTLEIVNFNLRGKQYAVAGTHESLAALEEALESRRGPTSKDPFLYVPGIDVPFHSSVLRDGVAEFRAHLDEGLPASIDPALLVGRYVPNLVPRPFSLARDFVEEVRDHVGPCGLDPVLEDFETWSAEPGRLTRELLVELLAWQFASPVRWIETQDLLFADRRDGGLGVRRVVEVGLGSAPTVANLASGTLAQDPALAALVSVHNLERDRLEVFGSDEDPSDPDDTPPADAPATAETPTPPTGPVPEMSVPTAPPVPTVPAAPGAAPGGSAAAPADLAVGAPEALRWLLALLTKQRPDQLADTDTIDDLVDGVSSRRNQLLMDLGAEFAVSGVDGARELPLGQLAIELAARAGRYRFPGPVLRDARDAALAPVLGPRRLKVRDVEARVTGHWGLGDGWTHRALMVLALDARDGQSARGGVLSRLDPSVRGGDDLVDAALALVAADAGTALPTPGAAGGGATVDAAAVDALEQRIAGPDGLLAAHARDLLARVAPSCDEPEADDTTAADRLVALDDEHGDRRAALVASRFDPRRHVVFRSWWATARHDVVALDHASRRGAVAAAELDAEAARLAAFSVDPGVAATAARIAERAGARGDDATRRRFERIVAGDAAPLDVAFVAPDLDASGAPLERAVGPERLDSLLSQLDSAGQSWTSTWLDQLAQLRGADRSDGPTGAFADQVALVTGASPGSIAFEVVRRLLHGGARVVCTTSSMSPDRLDEYRELYRSAATPGAELHVVPANLASFGDVDALVDWMLDAQLDRRGGVTRTLKDPMVPTLVVPFAAAPVAGDLADAGPAAEVTMRILVWGVERLLGRLTERLERQGTAGSRTTVLLPLSPNHGAFGGDGAYGEAKAALEAVVARWRSEHRRWGRHVDLVAATIGWVRGTGLMDANDALAALVERDLGVRTFSTAEMGWLLTGLCMPATVAAGAGEPLHADLSAGLGGLGCLRDAVAPLVDQLDARRELADGGAVDGGVVDGGVVERGESDAAPASDAVVPAMLSPVAVPSSPLAVDQELTAPVRRLEDMVVVVGAGEVGPWGMSSTRFDLELDGELADGSVAELAWVCGLVRFDPELDGGSWIDVESDEPVAESELAPRYREAVHERCGIRTYDVDGPLDPDGVPLMVEVFCESDVVIGAADEADARAYAAADPEHSRVQRSATGDWQVVRRAGSSIRVPRRATLTRRVGAQVPAGFDPTRWGIPAEMAASVDRLSLWNLVATVEAFLDAGLEPEELMARVHPARVGSTQGSGMGGMTSIQTLYRDAVLGGDHANDLLQEGLANVIAAYVVQSYVGSYGPMVHPVAACATAAVSIEDAVDKIRADKADVIVAGGWDDLALEGVLGFADMSATAATDELLDAGMEPRQFSRANDRRRAGFVEAQGGGTLLLARASTALELGLPVRGVVVSAQSFADGVHTSIPAPGMGALACVLGGERSPLAVALRDHGLAADDVAVVSKHDTSTAANDPNESELHQRIAEQLGRSAGNPMVVVSQKTVTGHAKGGSAAWQAIGLLQVLESGVVPGNRNLECLDESHRDHTALVYGHRSIHAAAPLRAGLLTSLGFGHVSAVVCLAGAATFHAAVRDQRGSEVRDRHLELAGRRRLDGERRRVAQRVGGPVTYRKRVDRRLAGEEGSEQRRTSEAEMLVDPTSRLGDDGVYHAGTAGSTGGPS
jgi:fatty acid synthase